MFNPMIGDNCMKKSMIALAVLGTFAAAASAQSSITLYGIAEPVVQIGYSSETNIKANNFGALGTAALGTTKLSSGVRVVDGNDGGVGASRFGMRGREDLGGGLAATFRLEAALQINNGAAEQSGGGAFFGRWATAGLAGGFGSVDLGKMLTPTFVVQANSEVQGSASGIADAWGYLANANGTFAGINGLARASNAITYNTPDLGGFGLSLMYASGGAKQTLPTGATSLVGSTGFGTPSCGSSCSANKGASISGSYANGPLYVGLAFEQVLSTDSPASAVVNSLTKSQGKLSVLGASYDFGVVKLFGNYSQKKQENTQVITATPTTTLLASTAKTYTISLSAPLGGGTGYLMAGKSKLEGDVMGQQVANASKYTKYDGKAYNIGYNYPLSKRTTITTNYGQGTIDQDWKLTTTGAADASVSIKDKSAAVGIRHTF
jgi:predicted porin